LEKQYIPIDKAYKKNFAGLKLKKVKTFGFRNLIFIIGIQLNIKI
tara:strand:- start:518 stop:652 length:135 start_codon:yes stop_codon:yes gene_type:complete